VEPLIDQLREVCTVRLGLDDEDLGAESALIPIMREACAQPERRHPTNAGQEIAPIHEYSLPFD
jgi:hypothetical protein